MGGGLAYPRRRLNPEFKKAVRLAMRDRRASGSVLALIAGFSHQATFSARLNAEVIPASPLTLERFQRVADALKFTGDILEAEGELVGAEARS
jgi:hypothetical protein